MKKLSVILFFFFVFMSCSVTRDLGGKSFIYKSKKRTLQLIFDNDSICRLKNTFHCKDIDVNVRELTIICRYKRVDDKIYLRNINCKNDSCIYDITLYVPPQESIQCDFLNEEKRKNKIFFGPNYTTEYQNYGLVPNIDIDTLYVQKNKIVLYKQNENASIGFVFK